MRMPKVKENMFTRSIGKMGSAGKMAIPKAHIKTAPTVKLTGRIKKIW